MKKHRNFQSEIFYLEYINVRDTIHIKISLTYNFRMKNKISTSIEVFEL